MSQDEHDNLNLTAGEFASRFTAEMLRIVGPIYYEADNHEPRQTAEYAAEVALTYYDEADQRVEGPEECARTDHSYWEEP